MDESVTVSMSPARSWFGASETTIRHAVMGFITVAGAKAEPLVGPALKAMEAGDFTQLMSINPKAVIGTFISGLIGAAAAAAIRWLWYFFTKQPVIQK